MTGDTVYIADEEALSEPGSRLVTEVRGMEVAVFNVDGEHYAVANHCVHEGGPLCEGPVNENIKSANEQNFFDIDEEQKVVHCPWHNWIFEINDGNCVNDSRYSVPTFATVLKDGGVYVEI
jgi:nitrite reductase/ring-hydroxylating ferredoxin subunit